MANSDLNVRLGLELRNFERGLKQAERSLRRTAQSLQSIGSDLTVGITAPILAAGGASLKAAAEFEQLRNALIAVTGDASIAEEQLARLRKIAEAPGVGFEQAVKATLQLQGLGFTAGQAENAITQVANAVAASGGGAEAFAGVVRQLGQIQAKNKVLQEDVGILLENAPILGARLQEAFGARTAEQISKLGVTGEEFVSRLVGNLEELERVNGGLANSFENFGISVRFALADVGQQINELFDIQVAVDGFVQVIGQAADVFRSLDDETKKTVVRVALFAAAVGPSILVTSKMIGVFNTLRSITLTVTTGFLKLFEANQRQGVSSLNLSNQLGRLAKSWRALNTVQQAFVATGIGLAIVAIASLVSLVQSLSSEYNKLSAATRAANNVQAEAEANARLEIATTGALINVITDETASREQRERALNSIQEKYPAYFGNLSLEKSSIEDITGAYDKFKQSIIQVSRARAAENSLTEIASREQKLLAEQRQIEADAQEAGLKAFLKRQTAGAGKDAIVLRTEANNEALGQLANERDAILKIFTDANNELAKLEGAAAGPSSTPAGATPAATPAGPDLAAQAAAQKAAAEDRQVAFSKSLREIAAGNEIIREGADLLEGSLVSALKPLQEFKSPLAGFLAEVNASVADIQVGLAAVGGSDLEIVNAQVSTLKQQIQAAAVAFGANSEAVRILKEQLAELQEVQFLTTAVEGLKSAFSGLVSDSLTSFFDALTEGKDAIKAFGDTAKQVLAKLVKDLLAAVAQAAILSVVFSIFSGGTSAGFGAIFKGLFKIPGLASGGTVPPGYPSDTYPALLTSGEVVVPPGKLPELGGGGGGELTGEIRLAGNDLVIALERFQNNRARTRGK